MSETGKMDFVPMISIKKTPDKRVDQCTDWVATEKVHGSSFQLYTKDGENVKVGSRRRNLDVSGSFLKCNIKDLLKVYGQCALKLWDLVRYQDRWEHYRASFEEDDDDDDSGSNEDNDGEEDNKKSEGKNDVATSNGNDGGNEDAEEACHVRIYGELYGGGGLEKGVKAAVQQEIIYSDEFRFYVFGLTINGKWLTISELNYLCQEANFPYYAKPVCEPKATLEELIQWLKDSGFMRTRSALTEKTDDHKCFIEGVVMTPLKRPDTRLHAVKFLAPAFTDVREAQFGQSKIANYCTKQRYHSVISKLDLHERQNTEMVLDMFVEDIIKDSPNKNPHIRMKEAWRKACLQWLTEDGYSDKGTQPEKNKKVEEKDDDNELLGAGKLFES